MIPILPALRSGLFYTWLYSTSFDHKRNFNLPVCFEAEELCKIQMPTID